METLDFCDYLNICNRLFSFCDYVRRRAPYADSVLLKDSQKWENELLPGYNNPQKLQLSCREYLKGKNVDEVAEYRQGILIEGTITALVDDLRSGAVSCPDNIKGWLILSIGGLATLCSYLSQICFAEFDKIKSPKKKSNLMDEEESAKKINEWRERIRKMQAYQEAVEKGWINDFRWTRKGDAPYLFQWLIDTGIATKKQHSVRWNIIDGVFENVNGEPITKNSLKSSYSQEG